MASEVSDVKALGLRRYGSALRDADRRTARLSRLLALSCPRRGARTPGAASFLLWAYVLLLGLLVSTHGASGYAQDLLGPCEPGVVQQRGWPRVLPVASRVAYTAPGAVRLEWLGHSSFLLTSPSGVRFIFRTGGLCVAHLGNLRHPLTPQQLQRIGRPDVALIPADGSVTLTFADVLTVIEQLRPALVIPIHIDVLAQATFFVQHTGGRYPVRQVAERFLMLSRALLPVATEIVILGAS